LTLHRTSPDDGRPPARARRCDEKGDRLPRPARFALAALVLSLGAPLALTAAGTTGSPYGPEPAGMALHPTRRAIIAAALGEVGAVSDIGGQHGFKKGWEHLKRYFDEGSDWGPDCFAMGKAVKDGIQLAGRNPPGGEWCGIFASWCCVQAGVDVRWKFGIGPRPLSAKYDVKNIAPGDIGVIPRFVHHFVIAARNGDTLTCVNGNSTNHGITVSTRHVSELCYYYQPIPEVWVPAGTGGGSTGTGTHATLREGSRGADVSLVQAILEKDGYTVSPTGYFGPVTDRAVRAFQASNGIAVDGVVGPATWAALLAP
jgi:hypothetical protein